MIPQGKIVPGIGPLDAKIAIIGEAPGAQEEIAGQPFVGGSGQMLNAILSHLGVRRENCYITNVVKIRPPSNNFGIYYDDAKKTIPSQYLRNCYSELHDEIRRVRPNVCILAGEEALRACSSRRGIGKWRGSIISGYTGKCVSTYSPSHILRQYDLLPIFEHDLRRAVEESLDPAIVLPQHTFELNPSYSRVIEFLSGLLLQPHPIAFDIETTKENHVRCLGIADSSLHALLIPFMSFSRTPSNGKTIWIGSTGSSTLNSHWEEEEEYQILRLLDRIFSDPRIHKYAQNFPFDAQILGREFGFKVAGFTHDTMVAAHTMYCELPKGLDFLASIHTRVPYYTDHDNSIDEDHWRYCCYDACVTWEITQVQRKDLESTRNRNGFSSLHFEQNHIEPAMKAMTRVGQRGVLIDLKVMETLRERYSAEMLPLEARFRTLSFMPEINLGSPKQLGELFYGKLHLPIQTHPKTGKPTTDEHALEKLADKFPIHKPLFDCLLDWKERQKLVSTYLDVPLLHGRFYTSFNVAATVNGRCNSAVNLWGYGSNIQNIPVRSDLGRPLRGMFISDAGYTIIKCDLSQAQWRVIVWAGKMTRFIKEYSDNPSYDIHRWLASQIYKVLETEVKKGQRDVAKSGVYGGMFHMMEKTAAKTYKMGLKDATVVLNGFWTTIHEIKDYWAQIEGKVNSLRELVSPMGRIRRFLSRLDNACYREAYTFIPQACEADVIHRAATLSEILFDPLECHVLMQIHDELVWQCRDELLSVYLPRIKTIMEYPLFFEEIEQPLIIPAELKTGKDWLNTITWKGQS